MTSDYTLLVIEGPIKPRSNSRRDQMRHALALSLVKDIAVEIQVKDRKYYQVRTTSDFWTKCKTPMRAAGWKITYIGALDWIRSQEILRERQELEEKIKSNGKKRMMTMRIKEGKK